MAGIIRPLFVAPAKHIYNMLSSSEYLQYNWLYSKLSGYPRYTNCYTKIKNWNLCIPDSASFLSCYKEIFLEKIYNFKTENIEPKILDLGANIGLSVLFFKSIYPQSKIWAFEADKKIFNYLQQNIHGNGYTDVELINKAVWYENTTLSFFSEGADGGRIASGDEGNIEIEAINISEILSNRDFDFVKIDIEGAEEIILPKCQNLLSRVKFLFIEYHSRISHKQSLDRILNVLSDAGFRIHMRNVAESPSPFIEVKFNGDFDLQINIFAWREK